MKELVKGITKDGILKVAKGALDKSARKAGFKEVKEAMKAALLEDKGEEWCEENMGEAKNAYNKLQKEIMSSTHNHHHCP